MDAYASRKSEDLALRKDIIIRCSLRMLKKLFLALEDLIIANIDEHAKDAPDQKVENFVRVSIDLIQDFTGPLLLDNEQEEDVVLHLFGEFLPFSSKPYRLLKAKVLDRNPEFKLRPNASLTVLIDQFDNSRY